MEKHYLAYMLRLWRVGGGEDAVWRALLESAATGERHAFASLDALLAFLEAETGASGRDAPLPRQPRVVKAGRRGTAKRGG